MAEAIRLAGLRADIALADAENLESIRSAVDDTHVKHARLDLLINCVGIQREELLADVTEEKFDEIYRVNVKAAMFAQECAATGRGGGGAQVHLLSVRANWDARARYSAYCRPGALVMLIKRTRRTAPHGIASMRAPTVVATQMGQHWRKQTDPPLYT